MPNITSLGQISPLILNVINQAVKLTTDDLLDELHRILEGTVYAGGGSEFTTGEFYDHWEKILTGITGSRCGSILQLMQGSLGGWEQWSHGNPYFGDAPAESFAGWYNEGTPNSGFNFPVVPAFGYWDKFEEYVDSNLDDILVGHMRSLGLNVI